MAVARRPPSPPRRCSWLTQQVAAQGQGGVAPAHVPSRQAWPGHSRLRTSIPGSFVLLRCFLHAPLCLTCLSVFQKTTTLNRQIRSIRLTYHITPTSKPNQKPSPITPPPNNTHHNAIHHSLTSPSPVNPNSSPMTPKPQTYRSHIYPLSHNSLCYSLNPQNHDTQTTTPLPISQISIPHIHTKDQQPLHTSIPTHTNNIPASRITLPLHRSSMPHY